MTVKIFAEIIFYIGHALTPFAPSIHRQLKPPGDKPTGLPSRNRNASLTEKYWFQTNFIPSISKETGPAGQRAGTKKPPCKSPIYIVFSIWRRTRCAPRHPLKLLGERVKNPPLSVKGIAVLLYRDKSRMDRECRPSVGPPWTIGGQPLAETIAVEHRYNCHSAAMWPVRHAAAGNQATDPKRVS